MLVFLMVLAGAAVYMAATYFRIQSISYEGTDRYTDEELTEYIFGDMGAVNLLKLKYDLKDRPKAEIPFIETYEIKLEYPDKVHVVLYEKSIVAYVMYKENYMYFDKDGKLQKFAMIVKDITQMKKEEEEYLHLISSFLYKVS